jgi:hypothetical protein
MVMVVHGCVMVMVVAVVVTVRGRGRDSSGMLFITLRYYDAAMCRCRTASFGLTC